MSELKFEDFLLFIEAKSKELVRRVLTDQPERPGYSMSDDLESMRKFELDDLEKNKFYQELSESDKNKVIETINSIFYRKDTGMETKVDKFGKIAQEMVDTYSRKNHDYGDSFGESIKKYGPIAGLVRMSDKWNRLNSLILGNEAKVKEESIIDTLTDLACYSVMLRMEMESQG